MNKSTICSLIGSVGVVTTSVLAVKCYKKTDENDDYKTTAKKYLPAIISGGVTIGCILSSDKLNKREIAALTASVAYFGQKINKYEQEVRNAIGDEKTDEINRKFYSKQIDKCVAAGNKLIDSNHMPKFIDKYSGATISAPYNDVEKGLLKCKQTYEENGYLCWCDLFYFINGSEEAYTSSIGERVGWSKEMFLDWYEKEMELIFSIKKLDDIGEKYLIDYTLDPDWGFMEY